MLIKRIELLSADLPTQQKFYADTLELPTQLKQGALEIQIGTSQLVLTQAPEGWVGAYHFCFNIPENQFAASKKWISSKTPLLQDEKGNDEFASDSWNSNSLYFKDAGGNILEFIARHDQKNASQTPFNSQQLLNISETGLPSKEVIPFANELCQTLGISVYRQEPNETFTPIGDEEGLLILPVENRIWYPNTSIPARLLSVHLNLEVNGKEFILTGMPYKVSRI
ncbi:MAG: hypothetical protein U0Z26_05350 [Anaerolineales bacterium]